MPIKILIVDDSKLARMSVGRLLSGLRPDWARLEAANAEEALAQVAAQRPDIVLLDFNMPGQSGLELAAQLREARPELPVALISANTQMEIVEKTRDTGATFLAKPLTEAALVEFLAAAEAGLARD